MLTRTLIVILCLSVAFAAECSGIYRDIIKFPDSDWWELREKVCNGGCKGNCTVTLPDARPEFGALWQASATVENNGDSCWAAIDNIINQCMRKERRDGGSWTWGGQKYTVGRNLVSVDPSSYKFQCKNKYGASRSDCEQVYQWSLGYFDRNHWYTEKELLAMSEKMGITWTAGYWMKLKTIGTCTLSLTYYQNKVYNPVWAGGYIQDFAARAANNCTEDGHSSFQQQSPGPSQYVFCLLDEKKASSCL
ncbi:hypothetical protein PROFUN_11502 [Planoprotostelium fungivorum]|uniref:C-type lectin domain-containing protein n=1 Tax=Planoprotostelium fungivorum TaxID=1890364 RepID=A0A2P6MZV8_9EUKA|nr:hypothetical protein PROFUN_15766 [Planoprotostelium fungivorum]PRP80762.1 hypothetical protein PROFUN_11502 [Planoprotostelium fungivorum]